MENLSREYKKSLSMIRVQTKNGKTAKTQIKKKREQVLRSTGHSLTIQN
jgi:hypothetical protein